MRPAMLLSLVLLVVPCVCSQEQAPTMDVCRADRAAWDDQEERIDYYNQEKNHITQGRENKNPIAKMSFNEINLRANEMATCVKVDEDNVFKYSDLADFYMLVIKDRYRNFIERHRLMQQFRDDDAAGLR